MGIRAAKDWLGEEILFLKDSQPIQYTAVTRTPTKLLKISKIAMLEELEPEYLQNLLLLLELIKSLHLIGGLSTLCVAVIVLLVN